MQAITMTDNESEPRRVAIENEIYENPQKTQREIADATGASRSWVGDILADDDALSSLREAYRRGIEFEATPRTVDHVAYAADRAGVDDVVVERLFASANRGDLESVRVELILDDEEVEDE